jgi:hypothetical protein
MKYLRRTTSAAAGNGLGTTINEHSSAMDNERRLGQRPRHHNQESATHNKRQWPGVTIKYLQCTTICAAGDGLGTTIKCLCAGAGCGLGNTAKYLRGAACISLGTTTKHLRRSTSCAAGNGLGTTTKYQRGAAGIGLGTTIKYLRCTTSAAANNGLGTTIKYLVN